MINIKIKDPKLPVSLLDSKGNFIKFLYLVLEENQLMKASIQILIQKGK